MTSSPAYVIDLVSVCKTFNRRTQSKGGYTTLKASCMQFLRGLSGFINPHPTGVAAAHAAGPSTTKVLDNVTIRIPRGASVGVIGRNGSGKSTLLKLITGIYQPDKGTIHVSGKIAALIELGAGFHPDFSGRENIELGGVLYGLTPREVAARFDRIVEFAELESVIDDPVRTYSSGMFMRLGFSLAVHTDPDILLIDEVLAVGDAAFITKCKEQIARLKRQGKTLLLVSHDLDAVERWSDEVLWLEGGNVRDRGEPRRVIDHYRQFIEKGEELDLLAGEARASVGAPTQSEISRPAEEAPDSAARPEERRIEPQRWGSREIEIVEVHLFGSGASGSTAAAEGAEGESSDGVQSLQGRVFHPDDGLEIRVRYKVHQTAQAPTDGIVFGIGIHRTDGLLIHGSNTDIERIAVPPLRAGGEVRYRVTRLGLFDGVYTVDVAVHRQDGYPFDYHKNSVRFSVRSPLKQVGVVVPQHSWQVLPS